MDISEREHGPWLESVVVSINIVLDKNLLGGTSIAWAFVKNHVFIDASWVSEGDAQVFFDETVESHVG